MSKKSLKFSLFILEMFWGFKGTSVYLLLQRPKQNKTVFCSPDSHCGIWNIWCFTSDHAKLIYIYLFLLYLYLQNWMFANRLFPLIQWIRTFLYIVCNFYPHFRGLGKSFPNYNLQLMQFKNVYYDKIIIIHIATYLQNLLVFYYNFILLLLCVAFSVVLQRPDCSSSTFLSDFSHDTTKAVNKDRAINKGN